MSRTIIKQKKLPLNQTLPTEPPSTTVDHVSEQDDSDVEFVLDSVAPKDETEKELERLVFGDTAGVLNSIKEFGRDEADDFNRDGHEAQNNLTGVSDAELFFTDIDPLGDLSALSAHAQVQKIAPRTVVWEDSDDERMVVDLAAVPRLRKLRRTADEDIVDGREYSARLREQYELLHPAPEWASFARERPSRKRRRLSAPDEASDTDMSDASDGEGTDQLTAPPLSSLLQSASSLIRGRETARGKKRKLKPEVIQIQRLADVGTTQPSAVTSLSFHPALPLLLSSGPSSTLYLHQIARSPPAPAPNPLLVSLHIKGTPLSTTAFNPADSRIFLSARRRYFHVWDLDTGQVEKVSQVIGHQHEQRTMERFKLSPDGQHIAILGSARQGGGVLNLLSSATLQWQAQVRVESRGGIADFQWWRNSVGLVIAGKNGEVTEWSMAEQRVIARWQDEGAVGTTVLALGGQHELSKSPIGTDRWIAIGSSSGIVNLYDRRAIVAAQLASSDKTILSTPKPYKVLDHLTTPTSHLAFSHDGQLLAMASQWKRDALRLVHLPSATVYRNWPTSATPFGRITSLAFADGEIIGGDIHSLLAVANEQGKIKTWEIM